jgi:DNA-binding transcriptional ArsR family regulator
MASNGLFAEVAALAGDPGRASMVHALMDGRALTATELTKVAGITPQTASGHLNRMIGVEYGKDYQTLTATNSFQHRRRPGDASATDAGSGRTVYPRGGSQAIIERL